MRRLSLGATLWRFGWRQTRKGAIIIGLLAGLMTGIQGIGYAATYPTAESRAQFKASLESAPALGVLYGESKNLATPASYMAYRVVPFMGFIASVWALFAVTRLLRGQEEDGRIELITAGAVTRRRATWQLALGYGTSLLVAFLLSTAITMAFSMPTQVQATVWDCLLVNVAIFLPAALFGDIGLLVSQLSTTRRRALLYGLVPLVAFFAMRSAANSITDIYWLKQLTPFGWSDLLSPVLNPQLGWLLLFAGFALGCIGLAMYGVGRRDLGAGLLRESDSATSHFALLGSPTALALRQNSLVFAGWCLAALGVSGLMTAIADVAARAAADSPLLAESIGKLGNADDLKIAFLGAGLVFTLIILLIMATASLASVRGDEAKGYVDNLLVQPIRRSQWLASRLFIITAVFTAISVLCTLATWLLAKNQGIHIDLGNFLLVSIALTGPAVFLLGVGALLYGIVPRLAAAGMYTVIAWSFAIDLLSSVFTLDDWMAKSSLLHYAILSPTAAPDWTAFAWLAGLGAAMAAVGVVLFTKRDIIAE